MQFEHYALNVPDPVAMANWYVLHCGMQIVRSVSESPWTQFLADRTGRVVAELYRNDSQPVPDYPNQHPLLFHMALAVTDAASEHARLLDAGATTFETVTLDDGSELVMLRDPWGVALQLVQRTDPMV